MKKIILPMALMAAYILTPAAYAQVVVRAAPPRIVVERPGPRPGPRYVWTPGYYRWSGARYIWVPGRYVLPPRPAAVWVAPRWIRRNGTWVFIRGYWR